MLGCDTMKILASDFDLTLYVKEEAVIKNNVSAISKFIKLGNLFCIITGRNYSNIKKLLTQYHIPYHYLICQDGAKIFDSMDYCFSTEYLSREKIEQILPIIEKYNFSYYLDDGYNETTNFDDCIKVACYLKGRIRAAEELTSELKPLGVYAYLSTDHINIVDNSVNKKNALEKVLLHADCNKNDLYVIGDSINDLEMLTAFQGAIMKNHHKNLEKLGKKNYSTLADYIEELEKN